MLTFSWLLDILHSVCFQPNKGLNEWDTRETTEIKKCKIQVALIGNAITLSEAFRYSNAPFEMSYDGAY